MLKSGKDNKTSWGIIINKIEPIKINKQTKFKYKKLRRTNSLKGLYSKLYDIANVVNKIEIWDPKSGGRDPMLVSTLVK